MKNNKKIAFITGIAGQDGSYLSELLLSLDYKVFGMIRRKSIVEHQADRIEDIGLRDDIELLHGDLTDTSSLEKLINLIQPDQIYNLAAQSHVRISSEIPKFTAEVNALGVLNILEAYKVIAQMQNSIKHLLQKCLETHRIAINIKERIQLNRLLAHMGIKSFGLQW